MGGADSAKSSLTDRQLECLHLTPFGSSKQIARKLGISPRTVDVHLRNAIAVLGANDRRHAYELVASLNDKATQFSSTQTTRIADLPTDQTHFPSKDDDGNDVQPMVFRDAATSEGSILDWHQVTHRSPWFWEGVSADDIKPMNRALMIIFGAVAFLIAATLTVTVVEAFHRIAD
jgi:DNA-binding CsgD family transcriptional regulator